MVKQKSINLVSGTNIYTYTVKPIYIVKPILHFFIDQEKSGQSGFKKLEERLESICNGLGQ